MQKHPKTPIRSFSTALFCFAASAVHSSSLPPDWPDLKPGMVTIESVVSGKPNPKLSMCSTQADKDAAIKASDEFMRSRKECAKPAYSKRGPVFVSVQHCKPVGEAAYADHTESTMVAANQVKTKNYRLINGKESMLMEVTHTRTGDCTGKESPQAGSLAGLIDKAMSEAAAGKVKKQ